MFQSQVRSHILKALSDIQFRKFKFNVKLLLLTIKEVQNSNYINKIRNPANLKNVKLEESSFMHRISMHNIGMQLVRHQGRNQHGARGGQLPPPNLGRCPPNRVLPWPQS